MSFARDDRYITDAQGRALAGAQVYWCTQPASTAANPPSPLATVYSSVSGGVMAQPVLTDGFGHASAYLDPSALYTVVVWHPLFGTVPVVLPDQSLTGAGANGLTPFSGIPSGVINGVNTVFTFSVPSAPSQVIVWLNYSLVANVGYTSSWASGVLTITYATAPQPASGSTAADSLYVQGWY